MHPDNLKLRNHDYIHVMLSKDSHFISHREFTQNQVYLLLSKVHVWFSWPKEHINRGII